ncbi:hypothetical protein A5M85_13955 [Cellulophaga lytica]|uniref:oligosaccharide flippase family protein n=1 Tax=Cellulophaga lytica TaxID=979 RepID=UPI0009506DF7|nr:oligosaccharide flippase family protein [Cellulophaga lytica]APU11342.1 hypothetical protein A5M85_13955 [Cellulophaga lytica]
MSQLKKGAFLNYASIILTNVVGLLLTPFIIRSLGDSEYGVYTTIGALVGTISLLDLGLNNTIIRFVAQYRAEKDKKGEENFLAITMLIYLFISIAVVASGFFIYNYADSYFEQMSIDEIALAKNMILFVIFNVAISLPGGSFTAICIAYENFVFPKALNIIRYIIRSITVTVILLYGGKAMSLVILDTIFNILIIVITIYYTFTRLNIKIKLHKFEWKYLRRIFSYSIWIFIYGIVAQFQWKVGHITLSKISTPEILSVYAVGLMLGGYYGAFSSAITSVFLPRATKMTVNKATPEMLTTEMIKIGRVSLIALFYILGAFTLYGLQFVNLWVGETYHDSWVIALMIMIAYTVPLAQGFTGPLIEAQNKVAFKSIIYLIFLFIGTVIGYFSSLKYGALGMITGTVIGWILAQNVMNFFYQRVMKLNILRFFKEIFNKILPIQILIVVIGYAINFIPGENWLNFIIKGLLYTLTFGILMYFFGMIPFEKKLIKDTFSKFSKK